LHGGFAGIIRIPWEFQQKEPDKKKIRGSDPFQGEKPGKTHFLGVNNGPKCTHLGSKRWQTGAEIACAVAAVAVGDAGVRGYSRCRSELNFHQLPGCSLAAGQCMVFLAGRRPML
jgi:hypothetical protein